MSRIGVRVTHFEYRPCALALKGERGVVEKNPIYARAYILSRAHFRALVSTLDNALKKKHNVSRPDKAMRLIGG